MQVWVLQQQTFYNTYTVSPKQVVHQTHGDNFVNS